MKNKRDKQKAYIAVDLGASNGRTILGQFDGAKLILEEMNRFENHHMRVGDAYYWDVLHLYSSILSGLRQAGKTTHGRLSGIGIDTWGVDFGLIDEQGQLLGNPHAYRDPRGLRGMQAFHQKYGERAAFDKTGIANMEFNTVYQLYDMVLFAALAKIVAKTNNMWNAEAEEYLLKHARPINVE